MTKKAFREGKIGRKDCIADSAGANPQSVQLDLPNGIETEPISAGQSGNLRRTRIQAMTATEIRADGHIPHAGSFYQNFKEYTSSHFTEIAGKVNQENKGEPSVGKAF